MSVVIARKVQKNIRMTEEQAALLDAASGIEGKDQSEIMAEGLRLRTALMGEDYSRLLEVALTLRFSDDPEARIRAAADLRDDVPGAIGGAKSVETALDLIRARAARTAGII